jgi:HEAT repeat protein
MRWWNAIGILITGLVLGFMVTEVRHKEPSYGGRRLSHWLAQLDLENSRPSEQAVCAVQAIGTNAFPLLMRMICSRDPLWKQALMTLNARQSLLRVAVTPASVFRDRAVEGYKALGARAKSNVPALVHLLETEPSPEVRSSVAAALGGIGPEARSAIPALMRATGDPSPDVRKESIWALANIRGWSNDRLFR